MKKIFLSTFLLLTATTIFAQTDSTKKTDLRGVTVYSAKKTSPVTYINLNSDKIQLNATGNEPSVMLSNSTPGITNYSDAGSYFGYSYIRMRGIDQTRINITMNGVPMNEPEDQGAYFSNQPDILTSCSKIEIQRGIGLSKNGVSNFGGSIQLTSANLLDSMHNRIGYTNGSFNSIRLFYEYTSGVKNRRALYARVSKTYSDGYRYNSSNSGKSYFTSAAYFGDKSIWQLNIFGGHQKNKLAWLGVSDSLIEIDRKTNVNINEKDNFFQNTIQLENKLDLSKISKLQTSVYYTYLKGNYDFNLNGFLGLPQNGEMYNYALKSSLLGMFINYNLHKGNFDFTAGYHTNMYERIHDGSELTLGSLYSNTGYKNENSIFGKIEYKYNKVLAFVDLQKRTSTFSYEGDGNFNLLTWNFINPKIGFSYNKSSNLMYYYSVGKIGREPTRTDMFGGNDNLLLDNDKNPILFITTPEYCIDNELGFRYFNSKLSINANLYYMQFTNEIVLNGKFGPNSLLLTDNVDKSFRKGLELSFIYKLNNHFKLINNSAYNYSRITENAVSFSPILTPAVIINQEIQYVNSGLYVSLFGKYQSKSYIDFSNLNSINNYYLFNSRIAYTFGKVTEMALFINNLTSTKYINNGYLDVDGTRKLFTQAPINYTFSLNFKF